MNDANKDKMTEGDFQKLLQIGLQSLGIQQTLLENQITELNLEMRTLERDDELEKLDRQLIAIKQDYQHYTTFINKNFKLDWTSYYD